MQGKSSGFIAAALLVGCNLAASALPSIGSSHASAPSGTVPTKTTALGRPTASENVTVPANPSANPSASAKPSQEPCAAVNAAWVSQSKAGVPTPAVAATLAHECLQSVPLGKQEALDLVDGLKPYLEWQSDLAYKKDPPKDYYYPGFDIMGELAGVRSDLEHDKYKGEYDFQLDLQKRVFFPGHDSHYIFASDLLFRTIRFARQVALVSVSEDGSSLPVIKIVDDVKGNATKARVVAKINGRDAAQYVEKLGDSASLYRDVDATYNAMFYSNVVGSRLGGGGGFHLHEYSGVLYNGANTTVEFADGTTMSWENKALVRDFDGVTDGPSFYKKFCTPRDRAKTHNNQTMPVPGKPTPGFPGFPKPVILNQDGLFAGYYLTGPGLDDVAVLTVYSFMVARNDEAQAVASDFLREASKAGKTKLVIDLQTNSGGSIHLAYDLFGQLFPGVDPRGNSRLREHEAFMDISKVLSQLGEKADYNDRSDTEKLQMLTMPLNYRNDMNLTNQNFVSFDDKFAPHVFKNTNYTALMRWNMSDPLATKDPKVGAGIEISGHGSRRNLTQYFKPGNIVMLHDGACGSACTMFAEMMRAEGGVPSIAMGGRPKEGPIQAIGGIKGSNAYHFWFIHQVAQYAANHTTDSNIKARLARITDLPVRRSIAAIVNNRDQIQRDNINDGVPAQYIKEDADCRLYWTVPMVNSVTEVWKAAANAAFNGAKCAHGSIAGSSKARRVVRAPGFASREVRLSAKLAAQPPVQHSELWYAIHGQEMPDLSPR